MLLGAHMSTAGGLHTAFERADALDCRAVQIFTSSPRRWKGRALSEADVQRFGDAWAASKSEVVLAHDIYLTRLGTRDEEILGKSRRAFIEQLEACQRLEIPFLVMHPVGDRDENEDAVLDRVAASLDHVFARVEEGVTRVLLETTAGQGANVGYRFEQLARIRETIDAPDRTGICLDTCHVFAAGYDIATRVGVECTLEAFDRALGMESLLALHLNDSRKGLGSRVDRHAHIGRGEIGEAGFEALLSDRRIRRLPMVIETPKDDDMDVENLGLLRKLAG